MLSGHWFGNCCPAKLQHEGSDLFEGLGQLFLQLDGSAFTGQLLHLPKVGQSEGNTPFEDRKGYGKLLRFTPSG